jgi:hypothetical protein
MYPFIYVCLCLENQMSGRTNNQVRGWSDDRSQGYETEINIPAGEENVGKVVKGMGNASR